LAISVREGEGKIVVRELNLRVLPRGLKEQVIGTSSSSDLPWCVWETKPKVWEGRIL
jgi:hypothetical protein